MSQPVHDVATELVVAVGDHNLQILGAVLFGLAVLHTFLVKRFEHLGNHFPEGSVGENFFHFLGETEAVFGIWATVLMVNIWGTLGLDGMIHYVETRNYTEPMFVFAIMTLAATRPILELAKSLFGKVASVIPAIHPNIAYFVTVLILGPILGSLITEPAAMTVTAIVLLERFFKQNMTMRFRYVTIGLLFVSISIGGTLTQYAAPPVLMVAESWGWDMKFMFTHFGYKAVISIVLCTIATATVFRNQLKGLTQPEEVEYEFKKVPWWVTAFHLIFMVGIVRFSHHPAIFMWIFGMFLAFYNISREYQDKLQLIPSLLVAVFLAGLVTLGGMQQWWLQPILSNLSDGALFVGATALTGITDNAALTYLGSLVENLTEIAKYLLVAGAVAGGGQTVIANAPNPAGYGILQETFGTDGISPLGLFAAALPFTIAAMLSFWFLPHLV